MSTDVDEELELGVSGDIELDAVVELLVGGVLGGAGTLPGDLVHGGELAFLGGVFGVGGGDSNVNGYVVGVVVFETDVANETFVHE